MMVTDYGCLDGAVECSTLTSEQAVGCLRYAGIKISVPMFRDGLAQGAFPFAVYISGKESKFLISKKKLEEWLLDFTGISVEVDKVLDGVKNL